MAIAVAATIACGPSAEPQPEEPAATAAPAAMLAPVFELPSGTGGTVSLASFAGDKNVVLVFYRGFW